ncbi:MAG TPA: hypothetical protein VJI97_00920, partial [Candidatus Nanoarchaeia archaeon]|nr:hypothetical protein [Candidatus Nanoarchaeia archaeon]
MALRKGIFFTIDALLASGIVILSIALLFNFYSSKPETTSINYASHDIVGILSTMKVGDINNEYAKSLILSGDIEKVNNTVLEQIGDFWANGEDELSYNFTRNVTEGLVPQGFGFSVLVNGDEIYSRNLPISNSLVTSRNIISGISKTQPTEGFTSRVFLNGIRSKKTSAYIYFGGYEGDGNLTKILILPSDVVSINSSYLEVQAGSNFTMHINGILSGNYSPVYSNSMLADKWNISQNHLANFVSGTNTIDIKFPNKNDNYIAGGFLKVTYITSSYNDTQTLGYETHYFPGIKGVINLYSSVYFPNTPDYMNASLHFNSPYPLYMAIGNQTLFQTEGSLNDQTLILNNSNLSSALDYSLLGQKTLPLRIGLRAANFSGYGTKADSLLITDRTGSMDACDVVVNCTAGLCDSSGTCHDTRMNVAIKSDKTFIDTILGTAGNSVGLVGFGTDTKHVCDFYELTGDNKSLKYQISNYSTQYCGFTCTSCGIVSAEELLMEKAGLYASNFTFKTNITPATVGRLNPISVTKMINISINQSTFLKSRLTFYGNNIATDQNYSQCVYFNKKYIGRACQSRDSTTDWQTCAYQLKPEWFVAGNQNVTITGGDIYGCYGTAGTTVNWNFQNVKILEWHATENSTLESYLYPGNVTIGESPYNGSKNFSFSINFDNSQTTSATLEFEANEVNPDYYDCVFVNNNYLGSVDFQRWNDTSTWQRMLFEIPVIWLNNGSNTINMTSGTTQGCKRNNTLNDNWIFRNVNLSIRTVNLTPNYDRFMSMLVMSDGDANTKIGDCAGCDSAGARNETITKACEAHDKYGIGIYAVAFGDAGATAISVLNRTACCDDCSHFYTSNNASQLLDIYTQIAQSVITVTFSSQTSNVTGTNVLTSKLYSDSFMTFNYSYQSDLYQNKIPLSFETERFGNNITSGYVTQEPNTTISEAKVTSYSGARWTDNVYANDNKIFKLSDYGSTYQDLGDPFIVSIPISNIVQGNNTINASTGTNSSGSSGGSPDDRAIYTLLINGFADYSSVVAKSEGCKWTVVFEDGTSTTINVPQSYSGANVCSYANGI